MLPQNPPTATHPHSSAVWKTNLTTLHVRKPSHSTWICKCRCSSGQRRMASAAPASADLCGSWKDSPGLGGAVCCGTVRGAISDSRAGGWKREPSCEQITTRNFRNPWTWTYFFSGSEETRNSFWFLLGPNKVVACGGSQSWGPFSSSYLGVWIPADVPSPAVLGARGGGDSVSGFGPVLLCPGTSDWAFSRSFWRCFDCPAYVHTAHACSQICWSARAHNHVWAPSKSEKSSLLFSFCSPHRFKWVF